MSELLAWIEKKQAQISVDIETDNLHDWDNHENVALLKQLEQIKKKLEALK